MKQVSLFYCIDQNPLVGENQQDANQEGDRCTYVFGIDQKNQCYQGHQWGKHPEIVLFVPVDCGGVHG